MNRRRSRSRRPDKALSRKVAGRSRGQVRTDEPPALEEAPPSIRRIGGGVKWLVGKAAGAVVGLVFIATATRMLSAVGGWETSLRVGAVTVVPLLVLLQVGPRLTSGFSNASPLAKYLRMKIAFFAGFGLLLLPVAFQWTGNPDACYHAFFGGGAGMALGFVAFLTFGWADPRSLNWMRNHRLGWRFFYRAASSVFTTLGVVVGLAVL